jgi:hypothetical protein
MATPPKRARAARPAFTPASAGARAAALKPMKGVSARAKRDGRTKKSDRPQAARKASPRKAAAPRKTLRGLKRPAGAARRAKSG